MQFKVPQFIDIEDKLFGPLTFKQFAYLAGGAGILYLSYSFLPFIFASLIGLPFGALAVALAFVKINSKPFIHTLEAFIKYNMRSRLYLWKKDSVQEKVKEQVAAVKGERSALTESKLKTLSWSLDVIDPNK